MHKLVKFQTTCEFTIMQNLIQNLLKSYTKTHCLPGESQQWMSDEFKKASRAFHLIQVT